MDLIYAQSAGNTPKRKLEIASYDPFNCVCSQRHYPDQETNIDRKLTSGQVCATMKPSIGGAKYFITPSIAHCDWVVYAVNTGDKPMGHWLLVALRDGP